MGILSKLKKLFSPDEKTVNEEREHIGIDEIKPYLDRRITEIDDLLKSKNEKLNSELSVIFDKLGGDIDKLSKVDLSNRRENEKLKQITEDGRAEYIISVNKLVDKLRNKEDAPSKIENEMNKFIRSSGKSYAKATVLIGKEMDVIGDSISNIKQIGKSFTSENSNLFLERNRMNDLMKKHEEKIYKENRKSELINEIQKAKNLTNKFKTQLSEFNDKILSIENREDYKKRESLLLDGKNTVSELKNIELKLISLLDRKILEKYVYLDKNSYNGKIVQEFLDDPVAKIKLDDDFQVYGVLSDIREKIMKGDIDVKKPEVEIGKFEMPKEIFANHRERILDFSEKIKEAERKIDDISVNLPNMEEVTEEKNKIEREISESNNKLEELNKKEEKVDKAIAELNSELIVGVN